QSARPTADHPAPGVYFRVALGGATGHRAFARDLGVLVRPQDALKVVVALVRVFIAKGNRADRKKARLKHLLEAWSLAQYLAETEGLLGFKLMRAPADGVREDGANGAMEYWSNGVMGNLVPNSITPSLHHSLTPLLQSDAAPAPHHANTRPSFPSVPHP